MSAERPSLHPQNDRVADEGLRWDRPHPRRPVEYVALDGGVRHEHPRCENLDAPYRTWGAEEALYAFGENRCDACWLHRLRMD